MPDCLMRIVLYCRCNAVQVPYPREESYSDCVDRGTTLYLLLVLSVCTVVSTPPCWDLSCSTYGRSPQVEVNVEVDIDLFFGIMSPLK
jgi:hypothetical protein